MKKMIALIGSVAAIAMSVPASATIISIISFPPDAFFSAAGNNAVYGAFPESAFDDTFTFDIVPSGTASFSLSTSSGISFTKILFNGVSYPGALSGLGYGPITITAGALDTIEIAGTTGGSFSGTVHFTPGAVPEPATWATFLLGFAFLGLGLRRRSAQNPVAA